jgi:hypothetical protein
MQKWPSIPGSIGARLPKRRHSATPSDQGKALEGSESARLSPAVIWAGNTGTNSPWCHYLVFFRNFGGWGVPKFWFVVKLERFNFLLSHHSEVFGRAFRSAPRLQRLATLPAQPKHSVPPSAEFV